MGWKIIGNTHNITKYIAISAPHTSNWDFLIGRCFAYIRDIKPKYLIKSELYIWPLSILIRRNGGVPVYRKKGKNTVDQVVDRLNATDEMILGIAPEGTRAKVEKWKTGFYFIAQKAKIPIVLFYIDYTKKEIGYFDVFWPSGNLQNDLNIIQNFYQEVQGKYPEKYNPNIY